MSIDSSKRKKIIILIVAIVVILGGLVFWWSNGRDVNEVSYREVVVKRGDIEVTVLATGTVQPENRLEIKAPVAGRMDTVLVKEGQRLRRGQVIAWMSSSERAAMLDAARAKGEEEYKKWSELYLATPIMAPISGTLILKSVEPGQTFTNADAIFTMSDRLTVKAQVDETDISRIRLKGRSEIVLDAYPEEKIEAVVDQIAFDSTKVNNVTSYIVDALPQQTPDFMRSGMTANVTFFIESRKGILLVPSEAIKVQAGKTLVNVVRPGGRSEWQEIEVGTNDGKNTEVLEGLQENDKVLITVVKQGPQAAKSSNPFMPFRGRAPGR